MLGRNIIKNACTNYANKKNCLTRKDKDPKEDGRITCDGGELPRRWQQIAWN